MIAMKKLLRNILIGALLIALLPVSGCRRRSSVIKEDAPGMGNIVGSTDNPLSADTIISPVLGDNGQSYTYRAALYFPYLDEPVLGREEREITFPSNVRVELAVLNELIQKGPGAGYTDLSAVINPDTRVVDISLVQGNLTVLLSQEFLLPHDNIRKVSAEWKDNATEAQLVLSDRRSAVYSIVNTLTEIGTATRVQIYVDINDDGVADPINRAEIGLPESESGETRLDALARQYDVVSTVSGTVNILFSCFNNKNYERLYKYIANIDGDLKPPLSEWEKVFGSGDWKLDNSSVRGSVIAHNGKTALTYVNMTYQNRELLDYPVRMVLDGGVWKISYQSLLSLLPQ